jgi:Tfp pilus assembly protein PilF
MKQVFGIVLSLVMVAGFFPGCSKETAPGQKPVASKMRSDPLSEAELRKFAGSVRRVDGDAEAHYQMALHFQDNYRHKLAIDELRQVLQRNPSHVKAYNALGVSYDNLGDHEAAIESYRIALNIDPKLGYVYNNLGYSCLLNGQTDAAVSAFQQAIAISPKEKRYRNNLGLAYVKQDRYEQAYEQFRVLDSTAGAERTFAKVMRDLGKAGQTEKALLAIRRDPEVRPQADHLDAAMPDLIESAEPSRENDPVARLRAVTGSMGKARSTASAAVSDSPSHEEGSPSSAAVQALLDEKPKASAAVVQIPAPPSSLDSPYEIKVAAAVPPEPAPPVAQEAVDHYPIAAVALADSSPRVKQPATLMRSPYVNEVQKEVRAIAPPQVMLAQPAAAESAEIREERILMAASSTRAAGWQNAPEPRATAQKGLVEVEVANGNGVKGSAGRVAEHLRRNGFNVVRVMDAHSQDHFDTKIFYYGNLAEARQVLSALPKSVAEDELYELESMGGRIRVLVGQDLTELRRPAIAKSSMPAASAR